MSEAELALDRIYEAALLSEFWPEALSLLDRQAGTAGGLLFVVNGPSVNWTATDNFRDTVEAFVAEGWMAHNPRMARGIPLNYSGFITDSEIVTAQEYASHPVYTHFFRPRGYGSCAGTSIAVPTGDILVFSFENRYADGVVPPEKIRLLDGFRPHLARAALMGSRLRLQNLQASVTGLEAVGLPAAVVGRQGRVLAANHSFETIGPAVATRAFGSFALRSDAANTLLQEALRLATSSHSAPRSIALPGNEEHPSLVFHVVPFRRQANDLFSGGQALVLATPVERPKAPPFEILNALFDLTPAEARIARQLTVGESLADIAIDTKISLETARKHLRNIFQKSGMRRQSELVGFLSGLGAPFQDR